MRWDLDEVATPIAYKLLAATVMPRPIAWMITQDAGGAVNAALADLATTPSVHIKPPRISDSPVALECRTHTTVKTGPSQLVIIGQVIAVHIEDQYVLNGELAHIDTPALNLIGRSYGSDYVRTHEVFQLTRPFWALRGKV